MTLESSKETTKHQNDERRGTGGHDKKRNSSEVNHPTGWPDISAFSFTSDCINLFEELCCPIGIDASIEADYKNDSANQEVQHETHHWQRRSQRKKNAAICIDGFDLAESEGISVKNCKSGLLNHRQISTVTLVSQYAGRLHQLG